MAVAAPPLVANLQVTMREVDDAIALCTLYPRAGAIHAHTGARSLVHGAREAGKWARIVAAASVRSAGGDW